jgi:ABC-type nickel/cobalt efflux system permease component RcnA
MSRFEIALAFALCTCSLLFAPSEVLAQAAHPFATPEQRLNFSLGGWFAEFSAQMAMWQSHFYRQLTGAVRAWQQDGWAAWLLLGLSFAYGVFHALGPGHGKAVLTAYVLANRETIRNGALLALLSAFLQAVVAVVLIGVAAGLLNVSGVTLNRATWWLELGSYFMMVALGLFLVYRHVIRAAFQRGAQGHQHPEHEHHAHEHHSHAHHGHAHDHAHQHTPTHQHDAECGCGHLHVPDPALVSGKLNWSRASSAILAVGLRPCTGAVFVLVFTLSQGFFIAGIAAALAMGLGTGLTVAALASASLWANHALEKIVDGPKLRLGMYLVAIVQGLASVAVLLFGLLMFSAAWMTHA